MDSDIHIIEPVDLFQRYIEPEFVDRAPRGTTHAIGDFGMTGPDGRPWGRSKKVVDNMKPGDVPPAWSHLKERYRPYEEMGWTGEAQLKAMDEEGVDIAVCYPSRGLHTLGVPDLDPGLGAALARAYNNWLFDFCAADRGRLFGAAMISVFDVNDAVSEIRRAVKDLGFRSAYLRPNLINGRNWYDPYYEPLWDALEEVNVPISFHEGSTSALPHVGEQFWDKDMLDHVYSHPVEMMLGAGAFCLGGVLARHPNLRVAFLEGNCSWLPWLLRRLDEDWEKVGARQAPDVKMAPSEYWKRQCVASVEPDEEPAKYVIDYLGDCTGLVFSTDFPHGDSQFPRAVDRFLEMQISDEDKRRILWDNCANYYSLA